LAMSQLGQLSTPIHGKLLKTSLVGKHARNIPFHKHKLVMSYPKASIYPKSLLSTTLLSTSFYIEHTTVPT
jgi:hypothetical protein